MLFQREKGLFLKRVSTKTETAPPSVSFFRSFRVFCGPIFFVRNVS